MIDLCRSQVAEVAVDQVAVVHEWSYFGLAVLVQSFPIAIQAFGRLRNCAPWSSSVGNPSLYRNLHARYFQGSEVDKGSPVGKKAFIRFASVTRWR